MSLSFHDHRFEEPKYTADECKEKGQTYSAPLYVVADFDNFDTGEIKSQTVFMGDFPLMTERGTFISTVPSVWLSPSWCVAPACTSSAASKRAPTS